MFSIIKHNKYCLVLYYSLVIIFISCSRSSTGRLTEIEPELVVQQGRLADIPSSAEDTKASRWGGMFSGECYLVFCAGSADIEVWISRSPSLQFQSPVMLDSSCRYLPDDFSDIRESDLSYQVDEYVPDYYHPLIMEKGRYYEIPPDSQGHNWGRVIIDDCKNRVYVNVIWS